VRFSTPCSAGWQDERGTFCQVETRLITVTVLVWRERGRALLADGSESVFDINEGTVLWDGEVRRIPVHKAETKPLIGMSLLQGYELTFEVQAGENVTVRALSQAKSV
jgi:predicted aspartyl protease